MAASDALLLRKWTIGRDADAFAEIVSRHSAMVYATCVRILSNRTEAEDVAQECFVELARARTAIKCSLSGWLHKAAVHRSLNRIKAERSRKHREERFVEETTMNAEPSWDDIQKHIDEAVAALPDKLREPIIYRFLEGQTHNAIAQHLGVSDSTVQYRLNKGIKQIRKFLKRRGVVAPTALLASLLGKHLAAEAAPVALTTALGKLAIAGAAGAVGSSVGTSATGIAALGGALMTKQIVAGGIAVGCVIAGLAVMQHRSSVEPRSAIAPPLIADVARPKRVGEPKVAQFEPALTSAESSLARIPVSGHTVDSLGQPVARASVTAGWRRGSWREGRPVKGGSASTLSGSDATFEFVIPAGNSPEKVRFYAGAQGLECVSEDYDLPREGLHNIVLTLSKTNASIEGIVVNQRGDPLPDAQVTAKRIPDMGLRGTAGPGWERTTTGSDGSFGLAELTSGTYELYVKPSGYRDYDNPYWDKQNRVTLQESEHKRGVRLVFGGGVVIWGTVTGAAGEPISNAEVSARKDPSPTEPDSRVIMAASTKQDGSYVFEGLPEGDYGVRMLASAQGYVRAERNSVTPGSEQDFVLQPAPLIEGRVVHAGTGAPITRFAVETWPTPEERSSEDNWYRLLRFDSVIEDEEGRFSVCTERGFGDITVAVKAEGFELGRVHLSGVAPGEVVKDVIVRLDGGGTVKGTVVNSTGEPVAGARVFLGYPPPLVAEGGIGDSGKRETLSSNDGTFQIAGVSPEIDVVSAYHRGCSPGWAAVDISRGGTSTVRIVLRDGGTLQGTVSLDGKPIGARECSVVARFPDGKSGQLSSTTQSDGTYTLTGLTPGATLVHCYLDTQEAPVTAGSRWLESRVSIVSGQTIRADFHFLSGYDATVQGTVLIEGVPAASAQVSVWFERAGGTRHYFGATTDEHGAYRLEGVPAGPLDGRVTGRTSAGRSFERSFALRTNAGEVTEQDIEIIR